MTRSGLNRHGYASVLLAVTLALIVTSPCMAQNAGGEWLVGRVEESGSGEPLAGVDVRIEGRTTIEGPTTIEGRATIEGGRDGRVTMAALTGADGGWRIGPLPAGEYSLTIAHIGFASVQRSVRIPQQDGPLRISLTARPLALDALIVTAGRRAQRLSEAAVATELITSREIRETGASDLASVLTERTGLELEGGHPVGQGVMIQGMGSERVLILLDGQPFIGRISGSIDVSRIPTSMIERVEVVKGPQSTLYGSEAMGGVVNVITRNPEASAWTTSATATTGNRGRTDIAGSVMGGAGAFTGLVDAGRRSVDLAPGWAGGSGAASGRWDALSKVGWRTPVDGLRLEASALLVDETQRWRSGQLYQFADNRQWSGRVGSVFERGRHRLTPTVYVTAFDHLSRRASTDQPVADTGERETQRLAEAELLYGVTAGRHALDVGIEARREAVRSDRVVGRDRTQHTIESYVQTTLTAGALTIVPGLRASRSDPWGTRWTPRIAAMYRPVPELALRISGGEGFRAPAFKELYMEFLNIGPGFAYTVRGNADLQPEISRNVTASVEWAGQQTWVRVQAFTNTFTDFIETRAIGDSSGVTVYTYGNIDDGFTRGGEVEAGAALGGWRLEGGYSFLRAERSETGEALLGRPGHSVRGTLGYTHRSGLRLSVTGVRTGRTAMSRTESGTEWRQPFARFDLRVARELPVGLELVAGMDNVLDQQMNDWPGFTGRHIYTSLSWRAARAGSDRN